MTAAQSTRDKDKLVTMSGEDIESFLKEYKGWVSLGIKNEIDGYLLDIESFKKKILGFKREREEVDSSVFLPEIKNRNKARIDQSILIEQEEIRRIASHVKKLGKYRREFTSLKFLKPMLLGLLEKDFYRFGFKSFTTGEIALAGWTSFIEIESMRFNFAAQATMPTTFLLGHYRIEMALTRRSFQLPIKIYNLDNLSSTTFPHPHINESFDPCLGDFGIPIQNCIEEKRFLHAFHLVHIFLCSYSINLYPGIDLNNRRPYAGAMIEHWPEKGSAEPPRKPPRERTDSYNG